MEASLASGTEVPNPCCGHCLASAPPGVAFPVLPRPRPLVNLRGRRSRVPASGGSPGCRVASTRARPLSFLFPAVTQQAMRDKKNRHVPGMRNAPFVVSRHAF
ncbi:hypothetical protein CDAR_122551 [Caerostris darwini]|uniref:Uncharacterized protein n=1 Tax=Caerostris darwini TaxID=1538125 RepID=A0AAV4M901_9ARAC|nr:hypothetical protein CDAR_122551 [Caerostris darwini]